MKSLNPVYTSSYDRWNALRNKEITMIVDNDTENTTKHTEHININNVVKKAPTPDFQQVSTLIIFKK
jgi:hypothetical protein